MVSAAPVPRAAEASGWVVWPGSIAQAVAWIASRITLVTTPVC
jgi:hypothetical protein